MIDLSTLLFAQKSRLNKQICRKCYARIHINATNCRKCSSRDLRCKKKLKN